MSRLGPEPRKSLPVLVPKLWQVDLWLRALVHILHTFRTANPEIPSNAVPGLLAMERPPLPRAVLAAEPLDDLTTTRVSVDIFGHVEDDSIDNNP